MFRGNYCCVAIFSVVVFVLTPILQDISSGLQHSVQSPQDYISQQYRLLWADNYL